LGSREKNKKNYPLNGLIRNRLADHIGEMGGRASAVNGVGSGHGKLKLKTGEKQRKTWL